MNILKELRELCDNAGDTMGRDGSYLSDQIVIIIREVEKIADFKLQKLFENVPPGREKVQGFVEELNRITTESSHDAPRVHRGLLYPVIEVLTALASVPITKEAINEGRKEEEPPKTAKQSYQTEDSTG